MKKAITIEQAKQLIHRYITSDITMDELAKENNLGQATVNRAVMTCRGYDIPELIEYKQQLEQIHGQRTNRNILSFDDNKLRQMILLYFSGALNVRELRDEFQVTDKDVKDLLEGRIHPHMQEFIQSKDKRLVIKNSGENSHRCKYPAATVHEVLYRQREQNQTEHQISEELNLPLHWLQRIVRGVSRKADIIEYERLWKMHGKFPFPDPFSKDSKYEFY